MIRLALIEAGHWHAPLYLDGLQSADVKIIAVSDKENDRGRAIAAEFGARFYHDYRELIGSEEIDFAFAFGRHVEMPEIGSRLIEARVPFSLEKPCGIRSADVAQLRAEARAANLFVAVPFIYRTSGFVKAIETLEGGLPTQLTHLSFRFIAGDPQRYSKAGCAWMLDRTQSGGGATANVGIHFLDLFRHLSGQEVAALSAVMSTATHHAGVEDFAAITLQGDGGTLGAIETGYTYPDRVHDQREFSFTIRSRRHYLSSSDDGIVVRDVTRPEIPVRTIPFERENDRYYPIYAKRVLEEWQAGVNPHSGLDEALAAIKLLEAAYTSAAANGELVSVER